MRTLTASRRHKVASFVLMLTRSRISDTDADVRQVEFVFLGGLFRRQRPGFFEQVVFRREEFVQQEFFGDFQRSSLLSVYCAMYCGSSWVPIGMSSYSGISMGARGVMLWICPLLTVMSAAPQSHSA